MLKWKRKFVNIYLVEDKIKTNYKISTTPYVHNKKKNFYVANGNTLWYPER